MRFEPQRALRARVASIDVIEARGQISVLPSANAVLGFQFRGRVAGESGLLSIAGVTGIQTGARDYSYLENTGSVLVRLTPQGATSLGVPGALLTDTSVPLDALVKPARLRELTGRLEESASDQARAACVEAFLLELPFAADHQLERAVELLTRNHSVAYSAAAIGLSQRQLERRFLQRIGLGPKRFAALKRFERAVALAPESRSFTDLSLRAGYADQSHFIREFRRFAGAAPGAVLRVR